eukprot:130973-Rhodomonas_salina.1
MKGRLLGIKIVNKLSGAATTVFNVYMPPKWDRRSRRNRNTILHRIQRCEGQVIAGGDWNVSWGNRTTNGVKTTRLRDIKFRKSVAEGWK